MVDHAYRNGITYFDTAWPYTAETSEGFLARALS
jgi:predicted aldo/keto reductase-like oxidoreductase